MTRTTTQERAAARRDLVAGKADYSPEHPGHKRLADDVRRAVTPDEMDRVREVNRACEELREHLTSVHASRFRKHLEMFRLHLSVDVGSEETHRLLDKLESYLRDDGRGLPLTSIGPSGIGGPYQDETREEDVR